MDKQIMLLLNRSLWEKEIIDDNVYHHVKRILEEETNEFISNS